MKTLSSRVLLPYSLLIAACYLPGFSVSATEGLQTPQPTKELHQLPSEVAIAAKTQALSQDASASRSQAVAQAYQSSVWFQSIDLTLRRDFNGNGFYSQLYVRFDAHTDYSSQPVYAVYSLISSNGVSRRIHTSSIFTLYGQSSQDSFAIETDMSNMVRDYYKLKIQLVDAKTGYLLAEMTGYDNRTLDRLALEDQQSDSYSQVVVVREESGGSFGILALLGLSCVYLSRRKQHSGQNSDARQHVIADNSGKGQHGFSADCR